MGLEKINIIIVDDHQIVLDGLARMLEFDTTIQCVGLCNSGAKAFDLLKYREVDLVLLDIEMPDENGIQFCQRIKSFYPKIKVIALSMLDQYNIIKEMIRAGADGYLIKNCDYKELISCIKMVSIGQNYYSPEIEKILKASKSKSRQAGFIPLLSAREKDVVKLILEEKTVIQTAKALFISINTVDTHRKNIMKKLDVKNVAGLVKVVLENRLLE